tara:strand:+ start:3149 stop:3340 length:192 start_codon:yes stop_codon:yes gene_type:complete
LPFQVFLFKVSGDGFISVLPEPKLVVTMRGAESQVWGLPWLNAADEQAAWIHRPDSWLIRFTV